VAVKKSKGLRVNSFIIFLSGLVLLTGGILVFLLIIKNVYGNYEIEEILPSEDNISNIVTVEKQKTVAILFSDYTQNMMAEGSTWLSDNVDTWESFLTSIKWSYVIISDQDIETGRHFEYPMVILPGSKSMSDRQLIQMKKYLERGGSIFSTGGPATYSDEGKWRGWEFFTEVFGMNFNKEIKPEEYYKIHTLRGNLPLTAGIPTGYTLKIATWDRPIYAEILEPRTTQVSFWFDFRTEAGLVREEIQRSAGIAYGTYGAGRFVWYGFEINSIIGEQEDYINFERLFNNSINWLSYSPTAFIKDWPDPYKAAMIIIPTLSKQVYNIQNFTTSFSSNEYSATTFIDPIEAFKYKSLTKSIANKNNLGAIVDIGYLEFAQDSVNKLYSKEIQSANIRSAVDSLEKYSGVKVNAIMPMNGFYDDNTLHAMAQNDLELLVTDSLTDRSVPKVAIMNGKNILVVTKTARDDYTVIREYGLTDLNFQRYTYEEDVDRILFEGGLFVLKVHTNYQLKPQYSQVIKDITKYAIKNDVWLTSLPSLKNWWFRRDGVEIRYETRSKRRVVIEVNNPRDRVSKDIVVQVNLNKPVKDIEISAEIITTKIPEFQFNSDTNILNLYIEELEANETRAYLVDFKNLNDN